MGQRSDLHNTLCEILGSTNVYFQPPETIKLKYPCIVYNLSSVNTVYANNSPYLLRKSYDIMIIDRDKDSTILDSVLKLNTAKFSRRFVSDNLYHYIVNIHF